jgi:hypothetical protein
LPVCPERDDVSESRAGIATKHKFHCQTPVFGEGHCKTFKLELDRAWHNHPPRLHARATVTSTNAWWFRIQLKYKTEFFLNTGQLFFEPEFGRYKSVYSGSGVQLDGNPCFEIEVWVSADGVGSKEAWVEITFDNPF